jgi:hypothetical protein
MKFKTGDRVSFLNETGGGTVNRIDPRGNIYVLTSDGFEIPVQEKELVLTKSFSYTEKEDEDEQPVIKAVIEPPKKSTGIKQEILPEIPSDIAMDATAALWLGFVPENPGPVFSSRIACYIINDSPYFLYYMAGKKESGSINYLGSGYIEADTKAFLSSFDQTSISKISHIHIQLLMVSKGRYNRKPPVDSMVDLNLVNFSKESYFRENDYFEEKAIVFNLIDGGPHFHTQSITVPDEVMDIKTRADSSAKAKKKEPVQQQDTLEVDLHYEGEANSQLTAGAILALQMSRFHAAIEEAISKNLRRVVIIHGLGQGTLKMQIRKELQEKYPGFIYQDASFREYGFGATMVHLIINQK